MSKILEAGSGFYFLELSGGDGEYPQLFVSKIPIIGWFVELPEKKDYAMAYPMTPSGVHKSDVFILAPNGEVSNGWDCSWSYDEWLRMQTEEFHKLKAQTGNGGKDGATAIRTPSLPTT